MTGAKSPGLGRRIALDTARGLHFLHSRKIVHFDLKSANILLSRDFTAKIADVGLAKIMQQQFLSTLYCIGTFAWAAPEVRQKCCHVYAYIASWMNWAVLQTHGSLRKCDLSLSILTFAASGCCRYTLSCNWCTASWMQLFLTRSCDHLQRQCQGALCCCTSCT